MISLNYDKYIVAFSGGKDSIACFLLLLELGVSKEKIELWHHCIDGDNETLMDWECTTDYCTKFAEAFGVPIYFSYKEGGFEREMLRNNQKTAPTIFEVPGGGTMKTGGIRGKESTRRKFPQISGDLSVRWCSAYLKIGVCSMAIRNQDRFNNSRTLVLSGERGEESPARGKYKLLEADTSDNRKGKSKRHVDRWRPIRDWKESMVWDIIKKYKVVAHPSYYMGWSRCSCKFCIFGNADQFKSAFEISPEIGIKLVNFEKDFGVTLKRKKNLTDLIANGTAYDTITEELKQISTSKEYTGEIFSNDWQLPSGAFGESCGPI